MKNAVNNITLWGRATDDAECRTYKKDGEETCYARFTVAVNIDNNNVDYIPCVVFGNYARKIGGYIKKGSPVLVNGMLRTSRYTRKDGTRATSFSVAVESLQLTASKNEAIEANKKRKAEKESPDDAGRENESSEFMNEDYSGELPF